MLICLIALFISSCEWQVNGCVSGDGNEETRTIDLDREISKIVLQIEAEVIISKGTSQEITIEGDGNLIDLIVNDSDLSGDTWEVKIDGCSNTDGLKIFATLEDLEMLIIEGSGKFKTEGSIFEQLEDLKLFIEGSGTMDIEIGTAGEVETKIEGSGNINIQLETTEKIKSSIQGSGKIESGGVTEELEQKIEGSGEMKFYDLIAQDAQITIEGSGDIEVFVEQSLNVTIDGSGKVCYKGNPTIDTDISGNGNVKNCN